ncbi:Proteinase inhibitor I3 [Macleaya cordata]|uniref:Proteinase inhibitor I3 n=1 Tax=Macleaya cordata TaxID=56857 RepID=A0A200QJW9_MACCD|nr:Proteinase inhibitor I3 [Macleaya cordata]
MKTLTSLLLLSLFFFAFSIKYSPVLAQTELESVRDIAGDELQTVEVSDGLPVTFTPVNPNEGIIRVSTDLNIKFSNVATICIQSMVWRLDLDESTGQRFIATNGVEGNPGFETLSNWFKIQKDGEDYKLVFCPTVCDFCRPICGDIGIYIGGDGVRRLAFTNPCTHRSIIEHSQKHHRSSTTIAVNRTRPSSCNVAAILDRVLPSADHLHVTPQPSSIEFCLLHLCDPPS